MTARYIRFFRDQDEGGPPYWLDCEFDVIEIYHIGASATHTSAPTQLDAGDHDSVEWTSFVPSGIIPDNTSIKFRFRTSDDAATWGDWTESTDYAASIDIGTLLGDTDKTKRYLQVETTLANTDGVSTPTLSAYTANYEYDDIPTPTCSDNIQNGDEEGLDCGGSCPACSESPTSDHCTNGIQDGDEEGVDCGGSCPACPKAPTICPPGQININGNCSVILMDLQLLAPDGKKNYSLGDNIKIEYQFDPGFLRPYIQQMIQQKTNYLYADVYLATDGHTFNKIIEDVKFWENATLVKENKIEKIRSFTFWKVPNYIGYLTHHARILVRIHYSHYDSPQSFKILSDNYKFSAVFAAYDGSNEFEISGSTTPPPDICIGDDCHCEGDSCWCLGPDCECTDPDICQPCVGENCQCVGDHCWCTGDNCLCNDPENCWPCIGKDCDCSGDQCVCTGDDCYCNDPDKCKDCTGPNCKKKPLPVCIGPWCININQEIVGIAESTSTTALGLGTLIATALLLLEGLAKVLTMIRPREILAYLIKGRDRKHARGIVYDASCGLGIPLAKILLFRSRDQKLIRIATSGSDGRFALETPPGEEYFVTVKKEGYEILTTINTKLLSGSLAYDNNYTGGHFRTNETQMLFDKAIPLITNSDSLKLALSSRILEHFNKILRVLNIPILLFGFLMSIVAILNTQSPYNITITTIYLLIFIYYAIRLLLLDGRNFGLVINQATGAGVDLAVVRAISETKGKLTRTVVTNEKGRYTLVLPKDFYKIIANKPQFKQLTPITARVKSSLKAQKTKIIMGEVRLEDRSKEYETKIKEQEAGDLSHEMETGQSQKSATPLTSYPLNTTHYTPPTVSDPKPPAPSNSAFRQPLQIPRPTNYPSQGRTFSDAGEIIERYSGEIKEIGKKNKEQQTDKNSVDYDIPNWKFT